MSEAGKSIPQMAKETGVSDVTLYLWRKRYLLQGKPMTEQTNPADKWTAQAKLNAVIETASMNETQLSEYCRHKGLYPTQVKQWKNEALAGYTENPKQNQKYSDNLKEEIKKNKKLEAELRRKEKALAETAALLVLAKKCQAIWGDTEEN